MTARDRFRFDGSVVFDAAGDFRYGYFYKVFMEEARRREDCVREMLGRWISELEPVVVYDQQQNILGLGFAGIPVGANGVICVRPA